MKSVAAGPAREPDLGAAPRRRTARAASGRDAAWPLAVVLGATALVLLANRDGLHAWFAADDFLWLELGTLDDVLRSFVGPWGHGALWRPLSRVSFYLDLRLFGRNAGLWHLESLLWHAATTTLLVLLLARTTGDRAFALATGAIFALLPMQRENTLWISARSHPVALSGALGSLLLVDRFLDAPSAGRLLASCGLLAAALLTYEAPVYTVPLAVLLVAARGRPIPWRRGGTAIVALSSVAVAYVVLRRLVLRGANLYVPHAPGWYLSPAFAARLGEVATDVLGQIRPSPWWFVAAALAGAVVAPRTLLLLAAGLVVAVVGYLPFSVVDGFGPRFAYATQTGLAMMLAAALTGLARVPRLGGPCAAVLLAALLVNELHETQQIAREWREAGALGRETLERLTAAWPDPDPDRPALILGVPASHGRALLFFTYFDLALGTFHPAYAGFRLPGHVLSDFDAKLSHAIAIDTWRREQERRQRHGLPPLVCAQGDPARTKTVDGFVQAMLDCDATFYTMDRNLAVRKLTRPLVEARLARGWRNR